MTALRFLGNLLLEFIFRKLVVLFKSGYAYIETKIKYKKIVEKHKEAVEAGDLNEIAKTGESVLNGDSAK